jgi:hypothetical protein
VTRTRRLGSSTPFEFVHSAILGQPDPTMIPTTRLKKIAVTTPAIAGVSPSVGPAPAWVAVRSAMPQPHLVDGAEIPYKELLSE